MTDDKLEEIRARWAGLGPWTYGRDSTKAPHFGSVWDGEPYADGADQVVIESEERGAQAIAAAPTDIAYLLAEVERLRVLLASERVAALEDVRRHAMSLIGNGQDLAAHGGEWTENEGRIRQWVGILLDGVAGAEVEPATHRVLAAVEYAESHVALDDLNARDVLDHEDEDDVIGRAQAANDAYRTLREGDDDD